MLEYWSKKPVKGNIVEETMRMVLSSWKIDKWNIYEKIIRDEETSTFKLEARHQTLDKLIRASGNNAKSS